MISLARADLYYQLCRKSTLGYRRVDHPLFRLFSERTTRLLRSLDGVEDEDWSEFVRVLRRHRFELSAAPLAFNDPAVAPLMDAAALNRFVATAAITHPRFAEPVRALVDILFRLMESSDNPLLDAIGVILSSARCGRAGIVMAEGRLVPPARASLRSLSAASGVEVTTADALRQADPYDLLIVLGPARWFPEHVFSAPRSRAIEVVSYAWLRSHWRPSPTFLAPTVGRAVPPRAPAADEGDGVDDAGPALDWTWIERRSAVEIGDNTASDAQDLVPARLHALQDGYAVFLEATGRRTTLVIDLDADEDDRVAQVADDDLEPGMFVVLRNDDSGDYLVAVADRLLGDRAASYRALEAEWKRRLRDHVRRHGLEETHRRLRAYGCQRAYDTIVRSWMSDRNIAPQSEQDFAAITRLVGMESDAKRLWAVARAIRLAHLRAGIQVRRRLVERVRAADVAELEARGRMDFELPEAEGGRLTAFRIEGRSGSTKLVPSAWIERAFKAEG